MPSMRMYCPRAYLAGEQLGLGLRTDDRDARLGFLVFFAEELALVDVHGLDLEHAGIDALDVEGVGANVVLHVDCL